MPYTIIRNDITRMRVDAIVNAANETLLGGGGVDGCIHRAAGPELLAECRALGGCKTGDAKLTQAYRLPCRYVIHTVGPIWHGGNRNEAALLRSCYLRSLEIACAQKLSSIAFPLISAGAYGYPKEEALKLATDTIRDFLMTHDLMVYIVIFDSASMPIGKKLYASIAQYIDDCYANAHAENLSARMRRVEEAQRLPIREPKASLETQASLRGALEEQAMPCASLADRLAALDESFSQMVLRKIDERGLTDAACYKRANVDRKLFSKLRGDVHYRPSKRTAVALAIALELPPQECAELLMKAGFALSRSNRFDVIIEYFIQNGVYDVAQINEALFDFDQPLLGC